MKKIYIEITNRCNLACPFCLPCSRPLTDMPVAAFAEVLQKLRGHTRHLALHVLGEPLLHPQLERLLALCHEHGMQVNLTTNGTLLAHHRHILLGAPALRQISVSLHSLAPLRSAAVAHLREIVGFALEASRMGRCYISLRLWNLGSEDQAGNRDWNEWLLAELAAAFALPRLDSQGLQAGRGVPLAPGVFLNPETGFSWPRASDPDLGGRGYCRGLRDHLAILVDGTVIPCCLDAEGTMALGNIFSQSVEAILSGPRARQMREAFDRQQLVEPLCRCCSYRLRFSEKNKKSGGS